MCQKPSNSRSIRDPGERKGCVQLGRLLYQQNYSRTGQFMWSYGLFTLHQNGLGNRTANGTGTIDKSGPWLLSLSWTSVNISTWYYTFHLISTQVLVPFPCSVNIPQAVDLQFVIMRIHEHYLVFYFVTRILQKQTTRKRVSISLHGKFHKLPGHFIMLSNPFSNLVFVTLVHKISLFLLIFVEFRYFPHRLRIKLRRVFSIFTEKKVL